MKIIHAYIYLSYVFMYKYDCECVLYMFLYMFVHMYFVLCLCCIYMHIPCRSINGKFQVVYISLCQALSSARSLPSLLPATPPVCALSLFVR